MSHRTTASRHVSCFVVALAIAFVRPAHAQDPTRGYATLAGEQVSFMVPFGFWDQAKNRVSMVFLTRPLSLEVEAASRKAGQWDVRNAGPAVIVDLTFKAGSTSALTDEVTSCRVSFAGFRGKLDIQGAAKDCYLLSVGGMLRSGGMVIGALQGEGKDHSLRLPFSVMFSSPSITVAAAPAPAPAAPAVPPVPAIPANTAAGSATYNGQRLAFTHGLAWWTAKDNEVQLALFDHAPRANMLAELKTGSWGEGGPNLILSFRSTPGSPLSISAITYCFVSGDFPRGGSIGMNGNAKSCGLTEMSGQARPGGSIAARLKGEGPGPGDKPFGWDIRLNLPIAR